MSFEAPSPTFLSKTQVEEYAGKVTDFLGIGIGEPLEPAVSKVGGTILFGGMGDAEVDGGAIIVRDFNDFEIHLSRMTSPIRDRFTIAHELGHLYLHFPAIKSSETGAAMKATRSIDITDEDQKRAEWEANWFAAALLMPRDAVREYAAQGANYIAARFNVSLQAANIRLNNIDS